MVFLPTMTMQLPKYAPFRAMVSYAAAPKGAFFKGGGPYARLSLGGQKGSQRSLGAARWGPAPAKGAAGCVQHGCALWSCWFGWSRPAFRLWPGTGDPFLAQANGHMGQRVPIFPGHLHQAHLGMVGDPGI